MISSQLSSQLFSKNMTWTLMQRKYPELSDRNCPSALNVTINEKCIYVHLKKSKLMRGISICVSFSNYLSLLIERNFTKASAASVKERANNIYTVPSSQGDGLQTIFISRTNIKCSCILFKCLNKRIKEESDYLYSLIQKSPFFQGNTVCHHIHAVIGYLGFWNLQDFYEHIPATKAKDSFGVYEE